METRDISTKPIRRQKFGPNGEGRGLKKRERGRDRGVKKRERERERSKEERERVCVCVRVCCQDTIRNKRPAGI